MTAGYIDIIAESALHGTLDEDGIFVQLADHHPVGYRMRRMVIYDTYEIWEAPLPQSEAAQDPTLFTSLVWLVEVTIDERGVQGFIRASVVVDTNNVKAHLQRLIQYMRDPV